MTAILDLKGCNELTRAIAVDEEGHPAGFADASDFAMLVGELNDNFEALVPANQPFNIQVMKYVAYKNTRGDIGELLDLLGTHWKKRVDLLSIVKDLVDYINVSKAERSWFLSNVAFENDELEDLESKGTFDVFKDMWRRTSASNSRQSEVLREGLNQSNFFVALVGWYYANSNSASGIFETAFENWQSRISGDPSLQQRLIVLLLDDAGRRWWETKYETKIPPEGKPFVKVLDANHSGLKAELEAWLSGVPVPGVPPGGSAVVTKKVIILGEPVGKLQETMAAAIEGLVSYLKGRAADLVEHWPDGWSERILQSDEVAQVLARNPLFVRGIRDRVATIREVQAELMPYLMTALGYSVNQWSSESSKLSRIYWRPDGPDWAEDNAGSGWTGQPQDFGARLAELAAFPNKPDRKAIVRYEDPRADNEAGTEFNRKLVITALQSAATRGAAGAGILPSTVPISFEKIEESIKKFTKDGLNIIALHDLEARPLDVEDTLRRFEGADKRIDSAVNSIFGFVERSPILRVAILLRNAAAFDGLTFDQSTSVRRWYLLKCPAGANGQPAYDDADYQNIAREARDILASAAG